MSLDLKTERPLKKLLTFQSILSFILLTIAVSAMVATVRISIRDVEDAQFMPVAFYGMLLTYVLGAGKWSWRITAIMLVLSGFSVIYLEAARLHAPIFALLQSIPAMDVSLLGNLLRREPADYSLLQEAFSKIFEASNAFLVRLLNELGLLTHASDKRAMLPTLTELLWDFPILFLSGWAGWWTSRRGLVLTALVPLLTLQAYLLNVSRMRSISLQVALFALIFLLGVNQRWTQRRSSATTMQRARRETYTTLLILSFALALTSGFVPASAFSDQERKTADPDKLSQTIGLENPNLAQYRPATSGLPRQQLVGSTPSQLQTVVMTVQTGEVAPLRDAAEVTTVAPVVPRHYWRWLVYDVYTGQGWNTTLVDIVQQDANLALFPIRGADYQIIHQVVTKQALTDTRVYWTGSLARVDRQTQVSWRVPPKLSNVTLSPLLYADMLGSLTTNQSYAADSLEANMTAEQLRAADKRYPVDIANRYLGLPGTVPDRVKELAQLLTAGATNSYDKAKSIETFLRSYPYTLDVPQPPRGRDVADYFLFDLKTGYCDYYATSMVVLARAAGLPARIVIGYASGEYDPTNAQYVVRQANAHSWVEVYFTDYGWVEFEPTANQPLIDREKPPEPKPEQTPDNGNVRDRPTAGIQKHGYYVNMNYTPLLVGAVLMLIAFLFLYLRSEGLFRSHPSVASIYRYVYQHGYRIYKDGPPNETPTAFARNLALRLRSRARWLSPAAEELNHLTGLYVRETYGRHELTEQDLQRAASIWRRLFWRLMYVRAGRPV